MAWRYIMKNKQDYKEIGTIQRTINVYYCNLIDDQIARVNEGRVDKINKTFLAQAIGYLLLPT